jgi:hypothetical protein
MLVRIIDDLKRTVPDAFVDVPPKIPWVETEREPEADLPKVYPMARDLPTRPTVFVAPNVEFPEDVEIPEPDEEIIREIGRRGTDALAWYVSLHQSSKWGIYFRARGIFFLSNLLKTKSNIYDLNERVKLAFDLVLYHELFHFLTDMTAAHMEMVYKMPVYNDYLGFVSSSPPESVLIEEALANAYALRRMPKRYHSQIRGFFAMQPSPYSHYRELVSDIDFTKGKRRLGAIVHFHNTSQILLQSLSSFPKTDEPFWEFIFNVEPEMIFLPQIPMYVVTERHPSCARIRFISPVTDGLKVAVFPDDHPPPHIHVWIPANNKKDGRYLYPSLEPYRGALPLSRNKRRKLEIVISRYRPEIERRLRI